MSLTKRILWAMVFGLTLGVIMNLVTASAGDAWLVQSINIYVIAGLFDAVGQIFVRTLTILVVPLVFVSLVCGSSALGNNSRMGIMAGKTLALYMVTTAAAISLALLFGVLIKPGEGIDLVTVSQFAAKEAPALKDTLIDIVPKNPVQAMAEGKMLQVIVFALLIGIAVSKSGEAGKRVAAFFNDFNEVILKLVTMLMQLAPYGVFCLLVKIFAQLGLEAIQSLAAYFFTVLAVLLLHGFFVYGTLLKTLTGLNPLIFFKKLRSVMMFAFGTSSSNATIPVTLRATEQRLGVDNKVASFTVPLGATINMDGTAIMQGVATAFIAQAYNIDIGVSGYLMVILTATLASIGTAGVPGAGLIMLTLVLSQVGLPPEGIALIIGVDRLLDMTRTAVNVTGDCMVSTVIAKSEQALDESVFNNPADELDEERKA